MICNKISCFFYRASFKRIIHSYINLLLSTCIVTILSLLSIITHSQSMYTVLVMWLLFMTFTVGWRGLHILPTTSTTQWPACEHGSFWWTYKNTHHKIYKIFKSFTFVAAIKLHVVINVCAQFYSAQNTQTRFLFDTPQVCIIIFCHRYTSCSCNNWIICWQRDWERLVSHSAVRGHLERWKRGNTYW